MRGYALLVPAESAAASAAITGTMSLTASWSVASAVSHPHSTAFTIPLTSGFSASGTMASTIFRAVALTVAEALALAATVTRGILIRAILLRHGREAEEQRERCCSQKHLVHHCLTLHTVCFASLCSTTELASGSITACTLERA